MSGRFAKRDDGQLALLDAMVFFSAALVVSATLLSYHVGSSDGTDAEPSLDAEDALRVFLRASVGSQVELGMEDPVLIRPGDQAGECLLVELRGISEGIPVGTFDPLNRLLSSMLSNITTPYAWRLSVFGDSASEMFGLGSSSLDGEAAVFACSVGLDDAEGRTYSAVLAISSRLC